MTKCQVITNIKVIRLGLLHVIAADQQTAVERRSDISTIHSPRLISNKRSSGIKLKCTHHNGKKWSKKVFDVIVSEVVFSHTSVGWFVSLTVNRIPQNVFTGHLRIIYTGSIAVTLSF